MLELVIVVDTLRLIMYNGNAINRNRYFPPCCHPISSQPEDSYYDTETGFYYLQSRYYDPAIGRFINADSYASTGQGFLGYNMFAYCGNNLIIYIDQFGMRPDEIYPIDIFGCEGVSRTCTISENIYTKNEGLIIGQGIFPYSSEAMGFGTYGKNGCGIIAAYNAMQLLGYKESLAVIETEIFIRGGYMMGGLLGITPWSIYSYFVDQGISCEAYYSYASLASDVQENSIIFYGAK